MNECAFVCTYMHVCIHTYVHKYINTYIPAYIHTCIHAYMYICADTKREKLKSWHVCRVDDETYFDVSRESSFGEVRSVMLELACRDSSINNYLILPPNDKKC